MQGDCPGSPEVSGSARRWAQWEREVGNTQQGEQLAAASLASGSSPPGSAACVQQRQGRASCGPGAGVAVALLCAAGGGSAHTGFSALPRHRNTRLGRASLYCAGILPTPSRDLPRVGHRQTLSCSRLQILGGWSGTFTLAWSNSAAYYCLCGFWKDCRIISSLSFLISE